MRDIFFDELLVFLVLLDFLVYDESSNHETEIAMSALKMVVAVEVRTVYGNTLIYPANEAAQTFARLAGKKTLSKADLDLIRSLGFEVDQIYQRLVA